MPREGTIQLEGAKIIYRNFRGQERPPYNAEGTRSFSVVLDDAKLAEALDRDGWNVKARPVDREDPEGPVELYLPIKMRYDVGRPPRVVLVTSGGKEDLGENEVEMLDGVDIITADLVIRPYHYGPTADGKEGISAYLQSLYVTIEEDPLDQKYADVPRRAK